MQGCRQEITTSARREWGGEAKQPTFASGVPLSHNVTGTDIDRARVSKEGRLDVNRLAQNRAGTTAAGSVVYRSRTAGIHSVGDRS